MVIQNPPVNSNNFLYDQEIIFRDFVQFGMTVRYTLLTVQVSKKSTFPPLSAPTHNIPSDKTGAGFTPANSNFLSHLFGEKMRIFIVWSAAERGLPEGVCPHPIITPASLNRKGSCKFRQIGCTSSENGTGSLSLNNAMSCVYRC